MSASFLHGVETIEIEKGARPVRTVKTAVIGLVGTAPIFDVDSTNQTVNKLTLIKNEIDAAKYFGADKSGYTIPQALDGIFDQGAGLVIAINVFDPTVHKTTVASTEQTLVAGKSVIPHEGITNLVVKNQAGDATYVLGTDYTFDSATKTIQRKTGGAITTDNATVKIGYDYADPTKVVASDIIGTVDEAGKRTGLKLLKDSYTEFGYNPKLLLAPAFCTTSSVRAEMEVVAAEIDAYSLVDAPVGTTVDQAIAGRGPSGTINFNTSNRRTILCFPHVKVYNSTTNAEELQPLSQRLAGVMAAKDIEKGYHWSPSNSEIKGIIGLERAISFKLKDSNCEANLLNEAGILTVINSFGTGFRTWGNRSAAYPASTLPTNFINIGRTADIIDESVEYATLQFIDYPIDNGLIDAICETVNGFLRTLIGKGALIDGKCTFNRAKNPTTEIANGHLVFSLDYMPPTPAERITYERFIDINMLKNLGGNN